MKSGTHVLVFDTADLASSLTDLAVTGIMQDSNAGTALAITPYVQSFNINGTTRHRLQAAFYASSNRAVFNLNTTNLTAAEHISFILTGYMPEYA